jgi:ABC-2 type transport system permease protein
MRAMILKELRQLRHDRRTLTMMIVLPLLLLVVFGYAASFDVESIPSAVVGPRAGEAGGRLPSAFAVEITRRDDDRAGAVDLLRRGEVDVAFVTGATPTVLIDGAELFSAQAALRVLGGRGPAGTAWRPEVLFNPGLETSAIMVPALAGMILVFVGTLITSLGVVRERQAGTLELLAVMPLRPRDVFVGKIAPYFLVAGADLAVILVVGTWLFDVPFRGSVAVLALGAVAFLFVTLGLGVLISSVSENQGQAIQLAILIMAPQLLLSGMIFPVESMAAGVRWISYLLPLTYFNQIARGVMLRDAPVDSLALPFTLLAVLGVATFGLAILRFRRDLAPSPRERVPEAAGAPV